jgi:hypothetical protein
MALQFVASRQKIWIFATLLYLNFIILKTHQSSKFSGMCINEFEKQICFDPKCGEYSYRLSACLGMSKYESTEKKLKGLQSLLPPGVTFAISGHVDVSTNFSCWPSIKYTVTCNDITREITDCSEVLGSQCHNEN